MSNQNLADKVVQHLGTLAPALAAIVWLRWQHGQKKRHSRSKVGEEEDSGAIIELDPSKKNPLSNSKAPLPSPLATPLLEAWLPITPAQLWAHAFGSSGDLLFDLHAGLRDTGTKLSPWRHKVGQAPACVLRFVTHLSNPLGPKQAFNVETFSALNLSKTQFVVLAVCKSEGVPFAGSFANYVQWVVTADGGGTKVCITGDCKFLRSVWGPLRGKIHSESIKGMVSAYRDVFRGILEKKYGTGVIIGGQSGGVSRLPTSAFVKPSVTLVAVATLLVLVYWWPLWKDMFGGGYDDYRDGDNIVVDGSGLTRE